MIDRSANLKIAKVLAKISPKLFVTAASLLLALSPIVSSTNVAQAVVNTASTALAVPGTQSLHSLACSTSGRFCLSAGVATGPNGATAGPPMIDLITPNGPDAPVFTGAFYVHDISCVSDTTCIAVGNTNDYVLGGSSAAYYVTITVDSADTLGNVSNPHPDPTQIAQGINPTLNGWNPLPLSTLQSVSCPNALSCVASGTFNSLVELVSFDPTSGNATTTITGLVGSQISVFALHCPLYNKCLVGRIDPNSPSNSVVGTFDPTTGTLGATNPVVGRLVGIGCTNPTTCEGLSEVTGPSGAILSIDVATGTPGTATTIPGGGIGNGGGAYYWSIACNTFSSCLAVGSVNTDLNTYFSATSPVAVPILNGVLGIPVTHPTVEASDTLTAVACPTATICYGAGATAYAGGPGHVSQGTAVALSSTGQQSLFKNINSPDGVACHSSGLPDGDIPLGGSNFQGVTDKSQSPLGGVYANISAADTCYDSGHHYTSSWVMLQDVGGTTFAQGGIAYHLGGGSNKPFVEISTNYWAGTNWTPPTSDGISVGSSIEFPRFARSTGTFTVLDRGVTRSQDWCSWVPSDARSHPELEGTGTPTSSNRFAPADKIEVDMNGSCLWEFYMPRNHTALAWADAYAEVHSYWQHVPGTPQHPLVFSNLHVYTDRWHNFVDKKAGNNGMPTNYICNQDTSSPSVALGKQYTFDTWGSTVLNTQFNPTCSSGAH